MEVEPSVQIIGDVDPNDCQFTYRRTLVQKKPNELGFKDIYVYDVKLPNQEHPTEMYFVPNDDDNEDDYIGPRRLPKWLRKKNRENNNRWREVHNTLKKTTKYAPDYFAPLPAVEAARPKFDENGDPIEYNDEK